MDEKLEKYLEELLKAIDVERKAEKEFHIKEIKRLSGKEREKRKRAILNARLRDTKEVLGSSRLIKVVTSKDLKDFEFSNGDVVLISLKNPLKDGIEAVVVEKTRHSLILAVDKYIPKKFFNSKVRIDLFANDITFQRAEEAIKAFLKGHVIFDRDVIAGKAETKVEVVNINILDKKLNEWQIKAVKRAVGADKLYLIHGPPGTGKTRTAIEVIRQEVARGKKVLATAPSNIAVDNLLEALAKHQLKVVRIGHPARAMRKLRKYCIDIMAKDHERYSKVEELIKEIEELSKEQERYTKPVAKFRRGLSDEEILLLAEKKLSIRGLGKRTIREMAGWIVLQRQKNKLFERAKKVEEEIFKEIIKNADVVCATNATAGSEILRDFVFDVCVMDEATQATPATSLIPLVRCRKVVMLGDHKQLPPTVLADDEETRRILSQSLFERLIEQYPEQSSLLRVQYRMNKEIMEFPNKEFYNGLLIADKSVEKIRLSDKYRAKEFPFDDTPVVFIDVKGKERRGKDSTSIKNEKEAKVVKRVVDFLVEENGVKEEDIGVITPYEDQKRILELLINKEVEISTVDGFQGREKEIVVISFVRSNKKGNLGFLTDYRRLNVAITRAKRKLILIGNSETLQKDTVYKKLIEYVKNLSGFYSMRDKNGWC